MPPPRRGKEVKQRGEEFWETCGTRPSLHRMNALQRPWLLLSCGFWVSPAILPSGHSDDRFLAPAPHCLPRCHSCSCLPTQTFAFTAPLPGMFLTSPKPACRSSLLSINVPSLEKPFPPSSCPLSARFIFPLCWGRRWYDCNDNTIPTKIFECLLCTRTFLHSLCMYYLINPHYKPRMCYHLDAAASIAASIQNGPQGFPPACAVPSLTDLHSY